MLTKNFENQQVLSSLYRNDVAIYLRDGLSECDIGSVNLHPSKRTHWVAYKKQNYFDSHGCSPSPKLSRFIIKRNVHSSYCQ